MKDEIGEYSAGGARQAVVQYGGALACVVVGLAGAAATHTLVDPLVFLLAAVLVAAWFSGLWPALLAALLSTISFTYFFVPPIYSLKADAEHLPQLLALSLVAVGFAGASAARHRVERALRQARDELDAKVRQRTAELEERANLLSLTLTERERAEQELQQLAGRLITAQEEERSRIGRELHDHISQMLGVLTIRMDQLRADDAIPPGVATELEALRQSTSEITTEVHNLSHRLHSSALDYLGLVPAVQRLVTEFSSRHGISIEFVHDAVPSRLPSDVALCLFRVTQEGLANIAKHSRAEAASVRVKGGPGGIDLTIEDAGAGFDLQSLERKAGLGFVSMRERLRAVRGKIRIESMPSRGTRIEAWVPPAA